MLKKTFFRFKIESLHKGLRPVQSAEDFDPRQRIRHVRSRGFFVGSRGGAAGSRNFLPRVGQEAAESQDCKVVIKKFIEKFLRLLNFTANGFSNCDSR